MCPACAARWLLALSSWLVLDAHCLRARHDHTRANDDKRPAVVTSLLDVADRADCAAFGGSLWEAKSSAIAELPPTQVASKPYATNVPVVYITGGGSREESFDKLFANFAPNQHRVPAVDGNNLSQVTDLLADANETLDWIAKRSVPWNVVGCMLSHIMAIRHAFTSGYDAALILEDDAVPLVPWWPASLEEFVLSLPDGWQASQMQWSINQNKGNFSELTDEKKGSGAGEAGDGLYQADSGWGTAAYLISRRGMRAIAQDLYNEEQGKYDVFRILRHCRKFSADDCLLGFTDTMNGRTAKEVKKTRLIQDIYRATPPFFLHASVRKKSHSLNACVDMLAATGAARASLPLARASGAPRRRLLLFVPATNLTQAAARQIRENVRRARSSAGEGCCDLHLAFRSEEWPHGWYRESSPPIDKFRLLAQHDADFGSAWRGSYDYVWALDPHADITAENIAEVLQAADDSEADVAQLAASATRHADLVSLAAPLIRTSAVATVLQRSTHDALLNCSAQDAVALQRDAAAGSSSGTLDGKLSISAGALRCISLQASASPTAPPEEAEPTALVRPAALRKGHGPRHGGRRSREAEED